MKPIWKSFFVALALGSAPLLASAPFQLVQAQASDPSVAQVQGFYDAAVQWGAESLHAPRLWPEYHPGYYGAFVRDPDGNNVEAVFHGAAGLVPPPGGSG